MGYPTTTTIFTDGAYFNFKIVYRLHNDVFREGNPGTAWSSPDWVMRDMNVGGADIVELLDDDHYPDPHDLNYTVYNARVQARVAPEKMQEFMKWYNTEVNVPRHKTIGLLSRIVRYFNTYDGEITLE